MSKDYDPIIGLAALLGIIVIGDYATNKENQYVQGGGDPNAAPMPVVLAAAAMGALLLLD